MKKHMLYAPALLLVLSVSCGKANSDDNKQELVTPVAQLNSEQPAPGEELAGVNPNVANPVADEVTPTPAPVPPVTPPAVNGNTAASTPATAAPAAPATPPARTPAPAPAAPAAPVTTAVLAPTTLTTGFKDVDTVCNKSFAGVEAFFTGKLEEFQALKLTAATNKICFDLLVTNTGALFDEMETLGLANLKFPITLNKTTWKPLATNPGIVPLLMDQAEGLMLNEKNNNLADATEELRYIELSIVEITSKDPADILPEDKQNLYVLSSSLEIQKKLITRIETRISKLSILSNYMDLGFIVGQLNETFRAPAPAPAATRPAAQPTSPAGASTSPTENTNTPTENPTSTGPTPQPTPAPGGPVPTPTPGPVPTPPGGPTPTP